MTPAPSPENFTHALFEIVLLTVMALFDGMGPDVMPRLSKETTVITSPLAADGLPDYTAEVLHLLGRGIPSDENAAVPLLAALWPMDMAVTELQSVCREVGAENSPPAFPPIDGSISEDAMTAELTKFVPADLATPVDHKESAIALRDAARLNPWRGDDLPPLRDWILERTEAIDLVVKAAERRRFYLPSAKLLDGDRGALLAAPDHTAVVLRGANVLQMRAMMRLGDGDTEAAWDDILAIHKLARSIAGPEQWAPAIRSLVACSVANGACNATLRLLDSPRLSATEIAVIRRDLAALPPVVNRGRFMEIERLSVVGWLVHLATMPPFARLDKFQDDVWSDDDPGRMLILATSFDWNVTLRVVSAFYDDLDHTLLPTTWQARKVRAMRLERNRRALEKLPEGMPKVRRVANFFISREARSQRFGEIMVAIMIPAMVDMDSAITRVEAKLALTRTAVALAAWRAGKGAGNFPESLAALVPATLESPLVDPFTSKSFVYERRGDGYWLYSLGANAMDDGGTDSHEPIVQGEWAYDSWSKPNHDEVDIVVRLPIPLPPALKALETATVRP